ncbi:chromate efflux transporter [Xanthobacter tagetidis]|uniref:chromate efflux transporter n=1 Tax=Xanthobacter tagetidis TaxID=60216 RepID=UPI001620F282|nr:chromate efflux transporter [Xanthobacter tagetidis]MBB6306542.1 chromate transporter [Xanthobacter tagetidis]
MARRHDQGAQGGAGEVFAVFLRLGFTSFGGPIAHLGYFREELVHRRRWLSDHAYADLVALCQFLPGPASSQVGMGVGLMRAGLPGLLAAFLGFTLPSAVAMVAFGLGFGMLGSDLAGGWLAGLKAAAAAVVAQAVLGMAASLCPERRTQTIALAGAAIAIGLGGIAGQLGAIAFGALAGALFLQPQVPREETELALLAVPRGLALGALALFFVLLALLPLLAAGGDGAVRLVDAFYRAGALVFGGGHVVLPLLDAETVATGLVSREAFLAGYGAAQAVPGPLFTFAGFLGAVAERPPSGIAGGLLALGAIFLPSALLVVGALPFWAQLRGIVPARRILAGVNAAVVGLLGAALWSPVLPEGVTSPATAVVALLAFLALVVWRVPAFAVVAGAALAGFVAL